jgi:thioredoxin-related protein
MFKKNILNFIIAALLLLVAAIYFSKEKFNHSGPQDSIWDNVSDNRPVNPNPPVVTPPDNGPIVVTTYEEALAEAKRSDKKVLVVFGAEWCTWCRKLDGTMKSQEVKKALIDGNIIQIHVDTDRRKELARKYSVRGIPAYVLIDKDENTIRSGSGFKDPANFVNWLMGRWGTNQGFLSWLFGR